VTRFYFEVNRDHKDMSIAGLCILMDIQVFYWLSRDDEVYAPYSKTLLKIGAPNVMSHLGRHYTISKNDIQLFVEAFNCT